MPNLPEKSRLRAVREEKGIKQLELAKAMGVSQGTISSWESGITLPRGIRLSKLASVLDVSVDYLLGRTDTPHPAPASFADFDSVASPDLPASQSPPTTLIIPEVLQGVRVAFHGGAQEGLTQDEVDKLAEYVEFILSKRGKPDEYL